MAATDEQVEQLRKMTGELVDTSEYDPDYFADVIERYPLEDARGEGPWIESTTTPGTLEENPDWTATYDLNAAAADIWDEKAALHAGAFTFTADGGMFMRSQVFDQHRKMARYYRSRRSPRTLTLRPEPLAQGTEEVTE